VPRVYGLGDLSQILDERAYAQARAILDSLREDLAKVVVTDSYRQAVAALDEHGFVLLVGEPAAGKTTIASMLAMAAADQWNASVLKLDEPGKLIEHWNPDEPSQFFWIDDAFGVTQYEEFLVRGWNHVIPGVKTILRQGGKVVMTSRDYIYSRARRDLKESAFPLLQESQVVIDVHALSGEERRQILYNHLKLGRQPAAFRTRIKPFLESVAMHPRFIPEIARRLAEPLFTGSLYINTYHLEQFVERREDLLKEILKGLDRHSKAGLSLIYMRNDLMRSPILLQDSERRALERLGSDLGACTEALQALNGSLVLYSRDSEGEPFWRFKHPTIGDAFAMILSENPELLEIYVQGSTADRLIEQITCGDVGVERAVVIPKALFPLVLSKLSEFGASNGYKAQWLARQRAESAIHGFLARRCSKEFLTSYIEAKPEILDEVSEPGLYLSAVSEVGLAVRLHEFGLLPQGYRSRFVSTVSDYAISGEDLYALENEGIQSVFTESELHELLHKVRTVLLPHLDQVRRDTEWNRSSDDMPDDYMQPFLDALDTLMVHFGADAHAAEIIEGQRRLANDWIAENAKEEPDRPGRVLGSVKDNGQANGGRSIFDDIDT